MANILNATYESDNFKPNSRTYNITITLDSEITVSEINNYLPNNGNNYKQIQGISLISSNSTATILSSGTFYICKFVAEHGSVNSTTNMKSGMWYCIGKKSYITT